MYSRTCTRNLTWQLFILGFASIVSVSAIMVPESWSEIYKMEVKSNNRNSIIGDLLNHERQRYQFRKSMPCISSFLTEYIIDVDRCSYLIPESDRGSTRILELFLKDERLNIAGFALNGEIDPEGKHRIASSSIILTGSAETLANVSSCILDLCGRDCKFVIILTTDSTDEESFLVEADNLIQLLWTQWVSRVVVLGSVHGSVLLAGSLSFVPDQVCTPSTPVLLGRCNDDEWTRFAAADELSLNGCIINLGYLDIYPYAFFDNETGELGGIEGVMMKEITHSLGGGLNGQKISWTGNTSVEDRIRTLLDDAAEIDLVIGGLLWDSNIDVDYSRTYESAKIVWVVPLIPNVSFRGLVKPFWANVWAAIGGVLLLGGFVRILLIRDISCLDIIALVLGVSTSKQPRRTSSRIQFISWSIFGFLLVQFYLGSLAEQLLHASDKEINSIRELASSEMQLGGTERFEKLFFEDIGDTDEITRKLHNRLIIFEQDEYMKQFNDLLAGRNDSMALMVMLNVSHTKSILSTHVHVVQESMGNFPIAFPAWRGLPYLERINLKIQDLIEAGFVGFWASKIYANASFYRDVDAEDSDSFLGLSQFIPVFLLLIIGYVIAFLLMIIEVIAYPSKLLQ